MKTDPPTQPRQSFEVLIFVEALAGVVGEEYGQVLGDNFDGIGNGRQETGEGLERVFGFQKLAPGSLEFVFYLEELPPLS